MTTVTDENVQPCSDGNLQRLPAHRRSSFRRHRLSAVNSINWAHILAQTVYYYFLFYFTIRRTLPTDAEPQFIAPTGNCGNILAGYYAKRMGLPMSKLVIATNANDILTRFWKTERYEKNINPGGDLRRIVVPDSALELARRDFTAERIDEKQIRSYIHTAVWLRVAGVLSPPPSKSSSPPHTPRSFLRRSQARSMGFDFNAVLLEAFKTLLTMEHRVIEVERSDVELVKGIVEQFTVM
ncbi:tryptophan synthase beta subunit-like PLP-dependent enzyme [Suillus lakei]|nr:tryptophan synthase beta subunit-like PLP-dependent enzyme [Suillus lakei]